MGANATCVRCQSIADAPAETPVIAKDFGDEPIHFGESFVSASSSLASPLFAEKAPSEDASEVPDYTLTAESSEAEPDKAAAMTCSASLSTTASSAAAVRDVASQVPGVKRPPIKIRPPSRTAGTSSAASKSTLDPDSPKSPKRKATQGKAYRNQNSNAHSQKELTPFGNLLQAAKPPAESEQAAAWIGSCAQNVLKADPQLSGSVSGCQCSGMKPQPRPGALDPLSTPNPDVDPASPTSPTRRLPPRRLSIASPTYAPELKEVNKSQDEGAAGELATTCAFGRTKSCPVEPRQLTPLEQKQLKQQHEHMTTRAGKLDKIGKSLEECNQQ